MIIIGELKHESGIYLITNIINGKVYVGSSVDLRKRMTKHKFDLIKGKHHCSHLQHSWNKYGEENFSFTVIELVPEKEQLIEREQHWIDSYRACVKSIGYNINPTAGTTLGRKSSEDETEKRRHSHPKNRPILQFNENGNLIREWLSISELSRELNIDRTTLMYRINNKSKFKNCYYIFKNEFSNDLLNDILLNEKILRNGRKVKQYNLNGDFVCQWDSSTIAGKTLNISRTSISSCCNGRYKSAGGFIWSYAN